MGFLRLSEQNANLRAAAELTKIRKQAERTQALDREAERRRQVESAQRFKQENASEDRLQWCVDRIEQLEAEVARLRRKVDEES